MANMGGTWWNLLTLEQLRGLDDEQIARRVNERLAPDRDLAGPFWAQPADFIAVQFYMSELDRRERRRDDAKRDKIETTRRRVDLGLELLIVLLIGVEIAFSILGYRQQSKDVKDQLKAFSDMQAVLSNMQDTSKATADTMAVLKTTTEIMAGSLQKQVELFYDVQVNVVYNETTKKLTVMNSGRSSITVWAQRVGEKTGPLVDYPKSTLIPPAGGYEISLEEGLIKIAAALPKGQIHNYEFRFLIKNEKQERFTVDGDLIAVWHGDTVGFNIPSIRLIPGWNRN